MKNVSEYTGFAIAITNYGPRLYIYNENLISIEEFMQIENNTAIDNSNHKYRLFKIYDTQFISFIAVGLN